MSTVEGKNSADGLVLVSDRRWTYVHYSRYICATSSNDLYMVAFGHIFSCAAATASDARWHIAVSPQDSR